MSKRKTKRETSTKEILREHSKAKVELYIQYLSNYLSILGNVRHITRVHLFDVLCGEGKYADNAEGSALKALRTILAYQTSVQNSTLKVSVMLNDSGQSIIEPGLKKIERVKQYASTIPLPAKTVVSYSSLEYDEVLQEVEATVSKLQSDEKALIFIDPWGYKSINPKKLRQLLAGGHTEILLFLPTAHMYRFANTAAGYLPNEEILECMKPLKGLLEELFDNDVPHFTSPEKFTKALNDRLKTALAATYTSSFFLETTDHNKYALFFFGSNLKGLQAFVDARWKIDTTAGRGHAATKQVSLPLYPVEDEHTADVLEFISSSPAVTNHEVFVFGLECGMKTTMTKQSLNTLREQGRISVEATDQKGNPPKGANFLGYKHDRTVEFKRTN